MRLFARSSLMFLALMSGVCMQASSAEAVEDVRFDPAFALDGSLSHVVVRRFKLKSTSTQSFDDVEINARVEEDELRIRNFDLVDGDTTITVKTDRAPLQVVRVGSRFSANGVATVDDGESSYDIPVVLTGRILERRGRYVLVGNILGALTVNQGGGNAYVDVLRVGISASVAKPSEEVTLVE